MTIPPARHLYLHTSPDPVAAVYHAPDPGGRTGSAVVLLPPWGWDEVASYRSRRAWAEQLASAGHPALRLDLPGTGDSAGDPADPGRVEAWVEAVDGAARWLRAAGGAQRLAVIGLGLGGLLAGEALSRGAPVDDLVLWAVPNQGRAFVRGAQAFSRLQDSGYPAGEEPDSPLPPEGWLESGGFVLSADTIAALRRLDLRSTSPGSVERALLLDRDGIAADEALRAHLEEAGVAVTVDAGEGWGAMIAHPERTEPPLEVFDRVSAWLDVPDSGGQAKASEAPREDEELCLDVDGVAVRESAVSFDTPFGRFPGVLTQPERPGVPGLCAVFLNAGAVRRTGPNRLWVEAARRWAAQGVVSLRFDLEGVGDADGDGGRFADVGEFYLPQVSDQVSLVLDELEARGLGPRFILGGLCSGGYWAFTAAARDERVRVALLLNPGALSWYPDLTLQREARELRRTLAPVGLGKLVRGQLTLRTIRNVARGVMRVLWRSVLRLRRPGGGRGAPGGGAPSRRSTTRWNGCTRPARGW